MRTSIKINDQYIQKILLGSTPVQRIYQSGSVVYEAGGSTPCFEVVNTISEASGDYVDVYAWDTEKWYKKNNLSQYEEYGIMEHTDDLSELTYYTGKLVVLSTNNHEYKWNGTTWVDLGECEGEAVLPDGYTQYQAIANNGNAYINTGYIPSSKTRILADMQITTSTTYGRLWGSGQWNAARSIQLDYEASTTGTIHGKWGTESTWNVNSNVRGDFNRHVYDMYDHYLYRDGDLVLTFASGTFTSQHNLAIFTYYNYGTPSSNQWINGRLYSFKIYDNGTLVRDFIPCKRDSDSKAGAYDIVNGVFYPSSSSNQFSTYGDPYTPLTPVEEYDEKVAPANNVHYNTLAELEMMECPWIGMVATIGEDYTVYVYTEDGWVIGDVPLDLPYLRFTALENTTFTFTKSNLAAADLEIKYSINGGPWKSMESGVATTTVPSGSYVVLKSNFKGYDTVDFMANGNFSSTGNFNLSGNIMSLIYGDEFVGQTSLANYKCVFGSLFRSCTKLKSISSEVLPATTLSTSCYYGLFSGCTGLTSIPANLLTATTLAERCYKNMFYGCTGITSIPSTLLPATNLSNQCYCGMFESSGVTSIPSGLLHSTNLAPHCYASMFSSSNITSIPSTLLPATTLAQSCYYRLFYKSKITSVPAGLLHATNLTDYCYQEMFSNCKSLKSADIELPATTVNNTMAYYNMFQNCTNLLEPPTIKATSVSGNNPFGRMFYGCSKMKYLVCDMLNEPSSSISKNWLYGVAATGTFYKNPNATWDQTITKGADTVPTGWNIVNSDIEPNYLTFTVVDPNGSTFTFPWNNTIEYSVDNGTWTSLTDYTTIPLVQENSSVRIRGTVVPSGGTSQAIAVTSSGKFNVSGNILTLLYGANYREGKIVKADKSYIFYRMFYNNTNVVDAGNLILPVFETAPTRGFQDMFRGCTSLTTSPVMKANNTGEYSFRDVFNRCSSLTTVNEVYCGNTNVESHVCMFENCTSLINVPNINVTTSRGWSVQWMFRGCTNLQSVVLKGNWGSSYSAAQVFNGCTNLTSVTYLGSSSPSSWNTENWLRDVPATGTFYMSNQYSWDRTVSRDANGVPAGWTIEKVDPNDY